MSRSLALLLGLTVRARYRRIVRGLATVRGLLLMVFGAGFFALMVVMPLISRHLAEGYEGPPPGRVFFQRFGPAALLAFAALSLFASSKYRGVYFSPAEVEFLFPGPFTRRELLLYRLATQSVHTLLSVLFMGLFLSSYLGGFCQTAVGLFLAFTFINLVQVAGSLLSGSLEERVVSLGRRFVLAVLLAIALLVFAASTAALRGGEEFREAVKDLISSEAVGWALLPLKTFSEVLAARTTGDLLIWGAGAVAVDLALLTLVLRLDVDYSEASLETSRRIYGRLQQLRRGGRPVATARRLRVSLPLPSFGGGLMPIAWRQAQEMVRETPGAAYLLLVFMVGAVLPIAVFSESGELRSGQVAKTLTGLVVALPFILSNWFRYDFRADLDRVELLLGLPVSAPVVALGQVLVPAFVLTVLQTAGILFILPSVEQPRELLLVRSLLLISFPMNLLFIAIENFFFLLFPARPSAAAPGDFQALGRVILTFTMKMASLMAVVFIAVLAGWVVSEACGGSFTAAALTFGGVVVLADVCAVLLVGRAFARFDVSRPAAE